MGNKSNGRKKQASGDARHCCLLLPPTLQPQNLFAIIEGNPNGVNKNAAARQLATAVDPASVLSEYCPPTCTPPPFAHRSIAAVITKLCELLRSPNRLVRTAASYGVEAVLKCCAPSCNQPHTQTIRNRKPVTTTSRQPAATHSLFAAAAKWTPSTSAALKQEAPTGSSNRFSFPLETLSLPQIIADEDPLLRESFDKVDSAQIGSDGADKVKKQLAGAIRDSFSSLSRNSIRFAMIVHANIHQTPFAILFLLCSQSFR